MPVVEAPKPPAAFSPILAYILGVIGVICLIPPLTVLGIGLLVGAYFAYKSAKQKYDAGQSAAQGNRTQSDRFGLNPSAAAAFRQADNVTRRSGRRCDHRDGDDDVTARDRCPACTRGAAAQARQQRSAGPAST